MDKCFMDQHDGAFGMSHHQKMKKGKYENVQLSPGMILTSRWLVYGLDGISYLCGMSVFRDEWLVGGENLLLPYLWEGGAPNPLQYKMLGNLGVYLIWLSKMELHYCFRAVVVVCVEEEDHRGTSLTTGGPLSSLGMCPAWHIVVARMCLLSVLVTGKLPLVELHEFTLKFISRNLKEEHMMYYQHWNHPS
ncbi:hypothetical protein AAG906_038123 [Vitis piasezkii]